MSSTSDSMPSNLITSLVLKPNGDGKFSMEDSSFLFPHEALRRDFLLTQRVLKNFDPWVHPWKAFCFHEWFQKYLLVVIHTHHNGEEEVVFPFYLNLGNPPAPPKQCADHVVLMKGLNDIAALSTELVDLAQNNNIGDGSSLSRAKAMQLVSQFNSLHEIMIEHLKEEEEYWPSVVKNYGKENHDRMVQQILKVELKLAGAAFGLFLASIVTAMGIQIGKTPTSVYDFPGWAGEAGKKEFMTTLPFPIRVFLLPGWHKKYLHLVAVLKSVEGQEDIYQIQQKIGQGGCQCVIG